MKAVVHIGAEKTGSTSIQAFLARNREQLAQQGMLYPSSLGATNQIRLTAYALDTSKIDEIRAGLGIHTPADVQSFRDALHSSMQNEIGARAGIHTLLMSNEHLQSRLVTAHEVRQLRDLIGNFADEIKIVVYLRRQDRVAVSHYSTKLKVGTSVDSEVFPDIEASGPLPAYYDYNRMLFLYEQIFGRDNIVVRLFENFDLNDQDLILDFCSMAAIDKNMVAVEIPRRNGSFSEVGIEFFKAYNRLAPRFQDKKPNVIWDDSLVPIMMREYEGLGPVVSRAMAEQFYHAFESGNEAIRARYFPERHGPLFSEDFSNYECREPHPPTLDDAFGVGVYLWNQRTIEIVNLKLEKSLLAFALHVARGDDVAAVAIPAGPVDPKSARRLAFETVGALLIQSQFSRAAALVSELSAALGSRHLFVLLAAACRLWDGDDQGARAVIGAHGQKKSLQRSLQWLSRPELRLSSPGDWDALRASDDTLIAELHERCIAWIQLGRRRTATV